MSILILRVLSKICLVSNENPFEDYLLWICFAFHLHMLLVQLNQHSECRLLTISYSVQM